MRTFLLGAGFSKAFHEPMPLMRELAVEVLEHLGLEADTLDPFRGDLEAWLSYLATRQPWEDDSSTLRNEALFLKVSEAIAQRIVLAGDQPDPQGERVVELLQRLVLDWRLHSSAVLTFNYDLLVEKAVCFWEPRTKAADLYPMPLIGRLPAGFIDASLPDEPPIELYKLHGSINWMYSDIGGPVVMPSIWPTSPREDDRRTRHLFADLRTLVVPPTSTKSAFYGADAIRALWRNAAAALAGTDELVVVGYSFPPSDGQVATMLRCTLPPHASIHIVTRDQGVADRARDAFKTHEVTALVSEQAAHDYVNVACGPIIEWSSQREGSGQRQWLTTPAGRVSRFVPADSTHNDQTEVRDELMRTWPSVARSWKAFRRPEHCDQVWRAYIDKCEWDAVQDPWVDAGP